MNKTIRLILLLLMVFNLVFPACAETDTTDMDISCSDDDEYSDYEKAFHNYCRVENGTLTLLEGVVTLGQY
ncbi:MAG: hypothetical protein J6Y48_16405, partial [Clostridia bacterium]|nr:hypothetical protein [Clostridia bacterium]